MKTGQLRGKLEWEASKHTALTCLANWSGVDNGQTSTKLFGGNVVPHQGRCDKGCLAVPKYLCGDLLARLL